jgi:2-alkyl-3-oxoalkanoate reductase
MLRSAGAEPVVADALNGAAMRSAVRAARPQVIVHELTALEGKTDIRTIDEGFQLTNRLRTEGTDILLSAAREAGVRRLVRRASRAGPTNAPAARSRPRTTHSTPTRRPRCAARWT